MEKPEGYFDDVLNDDNLAQVQRARKYTSTTSSENPASGSMARVQRPRISKFVEIDVDGESNTNQQPIPTTLYHARTDSRSRSSSFDSEIDGETSDSMTQVFSLHPRLYLLSLLAFIVLPLLYDTRWLGIPGTSVVGARAGVVRSSDPTTEIWPGKLRHKRADTNTDVCNRWAGQSAIVNGTVYLYGGHATQEPGQKNDTWTNDFLTIDLTKTWDISAPVVSGLPQPSGPPAVANGYLWNSYDSLYLYGGIVSDHPEAVPDPYSLWEYQIKAGKWVEHSNPKTSKGNNSDGGNQPVQQAGEGAGISVTELGRGYFFAGHYDHYTTPGWSVQVPRFYLKSLLEFTFPGYTNDGVEDLAGGKAAGSDGVWRNVTSGGIQDTAKFQYRADGALVYVPGYGEQGILLSIGGGIDDGNSFVSLFRKPVGLHG
ncbi:MAG: hypothetical protein LQ338_005645 [Usnochroma carphineum]|nr:MAG: hypothetical protein LQ338_005645 [Usnochroma carphineum]